MFFTLALSYLVGGIAITYETRTVVVATGITAAVCFSVTIFSIQIKFDFTKCGSLIFVLCMVLFLFGIITIFTFSYNWYVHVVYGALGALVFTLIQHKTKKRNEFFQPFVGSESGKATLHHICLKSWKSIPHDMRHCSFSRFKKYTKTSNLTKYKSSQ